MAVLTETPGRRPRWRWCAAGRARRAPAPPAPWRYPRLLGDPDPGRREVRPAARGTPAGRPGRRCRPGRPSPAGSPPAAAARSGGSPNSGTAVQVCRATRPIVRTGRRVDRQSLQGQRAGHRGEQTGRSGAITVTVTIVAVGLHSHLGAAVRRVLERRLIGPVGTPWPASSRAGPAGEVLDLTGAFQVVQAAGPAAWRPPRSGPPATRGSSGSPIASATRPGSPGRRDPVGSPSRTAAGGGGSGR